MTVTKPAPVNIRDLRHRITIQNLSTSSDGQGGVTSSWVDVATVWASYQQKSAFETLEDGTIRKREVAEFWIRYLESVNSTMRVVFDGRVFQLKGDPQVPDGRKFFMRLTCELGRGT